MPYEKIPKEYSQEALQKVIDKLQKDQRQSDDLSRKNAIDISQKLEQAIADLQDRITEATTPADTDQSYQSHLVPAPQGLKAFELITWGWATVSPWLRWKYFGKVSGYEFYGSQNQNFDPHADDYTETGEHYGTGTVGSEDVYLYTKDESDPSNTFILAPNLVKALPANQLILENATRSVKGNIDALESLKLKDADADFSTVIVGNPVRNVRLDTWATVTAVGSGELSLDTDIFTTVGEAYLVGAGRIDAYNLFDVKHKIKATGVKWVDGDTWRIYKYPANKLPSIGAFATFTKRTGNFYVRARSIGKGNSFSDFAPPLNQDPEQTTGLSSSEDLSTPVFVQPIHSDGQTCPIETDSGSANYGRPIHPITGLPVDWDDIVGGTRETDHLKFFGFEWCNVELVYNTIAEDDDDLDVFYNFRKKSSLPATPTVDEDEDESELS